MPSVRCPDRRLLENPTGPLGLIQVGALSAIGNSVLFPINSAGNIFQFADSISVNKGRHFMKFGADIRRVQMNGIFDLYSGGNYTFNTLQDFLENQPFSYFGALPGSNSNRGYRQSLFGIYAQDDWKILPRLTMNIGLRYDYNTSPTEAHGLNVNIRNPATDTAVTLGDPLYHAPKKMFWPRIGFAWIPFPDGKTVVRSGFGIFYDQLWMNLYGNTRWSPPHYHTTFFVSPEFPNPLAGNSGAVPVGINSPFQFNPSQPYMQYGSAGELGRSRGLEQVGFWRKILEHPSYDSWWQAQAMDKILAAQPLKVPMMLVHRLWDQEDIYGDIAVYKAIKPKDTGNDKVFLVMGPWHHGQEIEGGSSPGALKFNSDTDLYFRQEILRPFLAQYLKDGAPKANLSPVTAFETGTNQWRSLPAWPAGSASGCTVRPTPLYLTAGLKLSSSAPAPGDAAFDDYVSDPAKPVPFRARPIQPSGYTDGMTWSRWLVDDQREASGRSDVLVFVSDVLSAPVKISGQPVANLVASTSGTDSDWVVKLIDVYPDEVGAQPNMGGYELMVSADIFRGRYRESLETPKPIASDKPLLYRFNLPTANHVFLPGHKIMVQIQSSWFPLYDRNPQTFVPNIFWAKPTDYRKSTQQIFHTPGHMSFVELPLVIKP